MLKTLAANCDTGLSSFGTRMLKQGGEFKWKGRALKQSSMELCMGHGHLQMLGQSVCGHTNWVPVERRKNAKPNRIWKDDVKGSLEHDL
jgi:hypothetical protein